MYFVAKNVKGGASILTPIDTPEWSFSRGNRPLRLVTSHSHTELKRLGPTLLIGGVHGDEPEGIVIAESCLRWLLADARKPQPQVKTPWAVIPVLNPDGVFRGQRVNGGGVDLNRNYPSKDWSATAKSERYFPGPQAASEPEVQAVVKLIEEIKPRLIVHCHSWNPCIVATGAPARPAAEALARASGYKIVDEIGYPTPGSLSSYGWHDNKIPVICVEEQEHIEIHRVWPHFEKGFYELFIKNLGAQR